MKLAPIRNLILLLLIFCLPSCKKNNSDTKPNILLIIVDDEGYADFEPFDLHSAEIKKQNVSRIAAAGKIFTQAYTTAPVCSPSRAGLITGKYQFRWDKPASWGPGLPDSITTLADVLKSAGYDTYKIGKNDLGRNFHKHGVREYPLEHGFDHFLGFSAHAHDYFLNSDSIQAITPDPYGTSALLGPLMHNEGYKSYKNGYLTEILTDEAIKVIGEERIRPFFLTLSYNAVHHLIHQVPTKYLDMYDVPKIANYDPAQMLEYGKHKPGSYSAYYDKYSRLGAIAEEDMRQYYLANLHCLDDNVGKVLDALESNAIENNTVIIYVSDNGGSPLTGADNRPLTGGKYSLWEGGIRVPMAVSWPGKIDPGTREDHYVSTLDIWTTITNILNIPSNDQTLDGVNLLNPDPERLLVWKWQKTFAARLGKWKITNADENHWKSRPSAQYIPPISDSLNIKLFDLENDKEERYDLAEKHPEILEKIKAAYDNWCSTEIGKF